MADGTSSRLLTIPAELRNRLYNELLVDHEPHQRLHLEILVACRHIHSEASGHLTTDDEVHITIAASIGQPVISPDGHRRDSDTTQMWVHTEDYTTGSYTGGIQQGDNMPMLALPEGIDAWPKFLQQIQRLRLNIELQGNNSLFRNDLRAFSSVGTLLSSLTAFMEAGKRARVPQHRDRFGRQ